MRSFLQAVKQNPAGAGPNFYISELLRWLIKERKTGQKEWRGVEAWHGREAVYPPRGPTSFSEMRVLHCMESQRFNNDGPTFLRCRGPAGCLYSGTQPVGVVL
jgi:hypothetical protein